MIVERLLRLALVGSSWVLYLLLGLSVISFASMAERWLWFRRHAGNIDGLRRDLYTALAAKDLDGARKVLKQSRSVEAEVLGAALPFADGGPDAVADVIESELGRVRKELERGMTLLGTLGNNAPFIGLLGTVLGVIQAFNQLGAGGNKTAAMDGVMGGIAEALVATGVGLFVALPAVVAFNVIQGKIGEIETGVVGLGKLITGFLKAERGRIESDVAPTPSAPARLNGTKAATQNTLSVES